MFVHFKILKRYCTYDKALVQGTVETVYVFAHVCHILDS